MRAKEAAEMHQHLNATLGGGDDAKLDDMHKALQVNKEASHSPRGSPRRSGWLEWLAGLSGWLAG